MLKVLNFYLPYAVEFANVILLNKVDMISEEDLMKLEEIIRSVFLPFGCCCDDANFSITTERLIQLQTSLRRDIAR